LLLAVVAFYIVTTTGQLPDPVATHFGHRNLPNGWMSRDGYLAFMLAFATLLPIVIVGVVGWLPRVAPRSVNIPNREYWLAHPRRATTLTSLVSLACLLGCLVATLVAGIHFMIIEAAASIPPRLPATLFWLLLSGFVASLALWFGALWLRFRTLP
jgi:hypothetical protein